MKVIKTCDDQIFCQMPLVRFRTILLVIKAVQLYGTQAVLPFLLLGTVNKKHNRSETGRIK